MAHAHKPHFVFRRNGRVHLNRRGRQFSRLLAVEVCASAVVMLDAACSEVVWRVLATHSICQFPLHFPSCASPCAITFQLDSASLFRVFRLRYMLFSPVLMKFNCMADQRSTYLLRQLGNSENSSGHQNVSIGTSVPKGNDWYRVTQKNRTFWKTQQKLKKSKKKIYWQKLNH